MLPRIVIVLLLSTVSMAQSHDKPNFPTDEEINMVVSQAETAFGFYKISIDQEMIFPSYKKQGVASDRQSLEGGNTIVKRLKQHPGDFHAIFGFLLISTLDDASRNAALCSASGAIDILDGIQNETIKKAEASEYVNSIQSCQNASAQLYAVSQNVHALLVRELEGQQLLLGQFNDVLDKCGALVKKPKTRP